MAKYWRVQELPCIHNIRSREGEPIAQEFQANEWLDFSFLWLLCWPQTATNLVARQPWSLAIQNTQKMGEAKGWGWLMEVARASYMYLLVSGCVLSALLPFGPREKWRHSFVSSIPHGSSQCPLSKDEIMYTHTVLHTRCSHSWDWGQKILWTALNLGPFDYYC